MKTRGANPHAVCTPGTITQRNQLRLKFLPCDRPLAPYRKEWMTQATAFAGLAFFTYPVPLSGKRVPVMPNRVL